MAAEITNKGLELAAKLINGVVTLPFTYMAVGSGSTAFDATQTALVTEITDGGFARAAATCSYEANYKSVWSHTFTATAARNVREVAILDAASAGNMYMRHVYDADYALAIGDTLTVTVKDTHSSV